MNLDAIQAVCVARFRDSSNVIVSAADWQRYMNEVIRKVNGSTPLWPWLQTSTDASLSVTAGSRSTALPTDVLQVNSVYDDTNNQPLTSFMGRSGHWAEVSPTEVGLPVYYRVRGSNLEVYPLPETTTTLRVEVLTWPGDVACSAEPPWPETFHYLVVEGALALAYQDDGNMAWHDAHWSKFEAGLAEMKMAILQFQQQGYTQIRDTWWEDE